MPKKIEKVGEMEFIKKKITKNNSEEFYKL